MCSKESEELIIFRRGSEITGNTYFSGLESQGKDCKLMLCPIERHMTQFRGVLSLHHSLNLVLKITWSAHSCLMESALLEPARTAHYEE